MTTIIESIPAGLDVSPLREAHSDTLPEIRIEGNTVTIPVLVRAEGETGYAFYEVKAEWNGGDPSDYAAFCAKYYSQIRRMFYGTTDFENAKRDDCSWTRHELVVKDTFRAPGGSAPDGIARFAGIKAAFWSDVDAACASVGKTRADLPAYFTAETMAAWAAANGMDAASIASYSLKFSAVSLNLLHNNRNWKELF